MKMKINCRRKRNDAHGDKKGVDNSDSDYYVDANLQ